MNILKTLPLFLLLTTYAFAEDSSYEASFEDTPEFLQEAESLSISKKNPETWAWAFEVVKPDGTSTLISESNTLALVKPASTLKIFTGWWAFKLGGRTDAYLYQMLRRSENAMAESTAQRLGGVLAMQDFYVEKGLELNDTNFIAADASGLSYDNRANCDIEMKLLKLIRKDEGYERFKKLLAQPGKDGTLDKRLLNYAGKLFAKTGTLNATAGLSGYLETPNGTMVFCVLSDYLKVDLTTARKKIDAMVKKYYNQSLK